MRAHESDRIANGQDRRLSTAMPHPYKTSQIGPEIERLLIESAAPDTDLGLDLCQVATGPCELSSGIEHLFVSLTSKRIVEELSRERKDIKFQNVIYSPHTSVEKKCGFDLSVGHYEQPHRLRLMHKLLSGTYRGSAWIDEPWKWSLQGSNPKEGMRAKSQIRVLIQNFQHFDIYEPFLVLHVCFCIHEYRRMGLITNKGVAIPPFEDSRRTVIVDLRRIGKTDRWEQHLERESFDIQIWFDQKANRTEAIMITDKARINLDTWTFNDLMTHLKGPDANHWN